MTDAGCEPWAAKILDSATCALEDGWEETSFGQVALITDGVEQIVSFGSDPFGATPEPTTRFPVYCSGRVPLQLLLAHLVHTGRWDWTATLGGCGPAGELTLDEVLLHTYGLHELNGVLARIAPVDEIERELASLRVDATRPCRYSDYAAGHLMGRHAEAAAGVDYRAALPAWCGIDAGQLSTFVDVRTGRAASALGDCTTWNVQKWNPAFGWYWSALGLARSTATAVRNLGGFDSGELSDLLEPRASNPWDESLERPLTLSRIGNVNFMGSRFSGLAGQGGLSFCGIDPTTRSVAAFFVSPALPTPAALARSARLMGVLDSWAAHSTARLSARR